MITSTELWAMKRILSLHSRKELRFASIPLVQLFLLVLLMFMKISFASLLQSARIAPTQAVGLLTYEPWLIPTCESSDSHRQQTKFAAFRYVLRPPRIYICKFEPGREAEVVPEDKKVHGLYVYGTFMNPF